MILRAATLATALWVLQQSAPFHVETRLVVLHATVRNARGELVTGLTREAFSVFENGMRQPITVFRNDDVPVSLGLLIDNSGSMRTKRARVEAAALDFARASNPQDEIFVLNFADKSRVDVPFTSDLRVLEAGITRVDAIGGTALRDAIAAGEAYVTQFARRDRKALVVITDGNDNASLTSLDAIRAPAERDDIALYCVGLLGEQDPHAGRARRDLQQLVDSTGGVASFPKSLDEIDAVALELARQIRTQYTIGYSPLNHALDGSYRSIRVKVKGGEPLTVRSRTGYRAVPSSP
jgi:Ca-activated chloride channel family protein